MAAKFWFVKTQPKLETVAENCQSMELLQIHKFLWKKIEASENHQKYGNNTKSELSSLEPHQDFEIRMKSSGSIFCDVDKHYEIMTGKSRILFNATQQNSICCCFRNEYESIVVTNLDKVPVLQIQKSESSGYISKKLSFTISLPCGMKVGEICRIEGFLEKPKYEIKDSQDENLFSLVIQSEGCLTHPSYVLGKTGKIASLQDTGGSYKLKIYHFCSMEEKALLLSLTMILDLVKRNG